jgi:hypothetical protein
MTEEDFNALLTEEDFNALRAAVAALEHPGLTARLGEIAGKPIELLGRALPEAASKAVAAATTKAFNAALAVALRTMQNEPKGTSRLLHSVGGGVRGAGWWLRYRRFAGRASNLNHHHAAVDRRCRTQ